MQNLKENIILDYIFSIIHLRSWGDAYSNTIITLVSFVCGYYGAIVLDNYNLFMAIATVVAVDAVFGNLVASKNGVWEVKKAMKVVYYLATYWVLLSMVLSIEKGYPSAFFLSEAIIMPILLFQSISVLKNISLLGWIPNSALTNILEKIDGYKNKTINTERPSE